MKKNHVLLLSIEILMMLIIVFGIFISGFFKVNNLPYTVFWLISTLILFFRFGFEKDKHLYKTDILQIIFLYSISYIMLTYLFGIVVGFTESPYNMELLSIINNIFLIVVIIICQEMIRYVIVTKGNKLTITLIIFLFVIADIFIKINSYNFQNPTEIFEFIGLLLIPIIFNNFLLTYISKKVGYKPALLYRLIFELPIYIIAIQPNMGAYINSILNVIFPTILFLKLNSFFGDGKYIRIKSSKFKRLIFWLPATFVILFLVITVSGLFKIYTLAIASNSMKNAITRGDAVIVEKLSDKDIDQLQIGDIIVYEHDNKMIVHRIVDIKIYSSNKYILNTKGDNNDNVDNYDIELSKIKGIVRYKIPFIGYPSVWVSELVK